VDSFVGHASAVKARANLCPYFADIFARKNACTESLFVIEIEVVDLLAPVAEPCAVSKFPLSGKERTEPLHAGLPDGEIHLLNEPRQKRTDQCVRSMMRIPNTERRKEVTSAHAKALVPLPLDPDSFDDHTAEPYGSIDDGTTRVELLGVFSLESARNPPEVVDAAARRVGETDLCQAAPVGVRGGVEVEIDIAHGECPSVRIEIAGDDG